MREHREAIDTRPLDPASYPRCSCQRPFVMSSMADSPRDGSSDESPERPSPQTLPFVRRKRSRSSRPSRTPRPRLAVPSPPRRRRATQPADRHLVKQQRRARECRHDVSGHSFRRRSGPRLRGAVARIVTGSHDAYRQDPHLPMRYDTGRPSSVIRLRIAQPGDGLTPCPERTPPVGAPRLASGPTGRSRPAIAAHAATGRPTRPNTGTRRAPPRLHAERLCALR